MKKREFLYLIIFFIGGVFGIFVMDHIHTTKEAQAQEIVLNTTIQNDVTCEVKYLSSMICAVCYNKNDIEMKCHQ